ENPRRILEHEVADGNFLPEDDREFLGLKKLKHALLREKIGSEERRGVEFQDFELPHNLFCRTSAGELVPGGNVSVMVLIPTGYSKAKLDSWYLSPTVFLANGQQPDRANSEQELFGRKWQFWSRHLDECAWRDGIDGLETYLQYIRKGLR